MSDVEVTETGFRWGSLQVERVMAFDGSHVLRITPVGRPDSSQAIDVYVSRTGRSIRAFKGSAEMKRAKASTPDRALEIK